MGLHGCTGVAHVRGPVGQGDVRFVFAVEVIVDGVGPGGVDLQLLALGHGGHVLAVARGKGQQRQANTNNPATKGERLMQQGGFGRPVRFVIYITRNRGGVITS